MLLRLTSAVDFLLIMGPIAAKQLTKQSVQTDQGERDEQRPRDADA